MTTDDILISLAARNGRNIKDMDGFKREFFLTIYGGQLKLMHRSYWERAL